MWVSGAEAHTCNDFDVATEAATHKAFLRPNYFPAADTTGSSPPVRPEARRRTSIPRRLIF